MKLLLVLLVVLGCKRDSAPVDRWPEVERRTTPTIPGGDGALLDQALALVTHDDVPEVALEHLIAWRKAGGGVPWRGGHPVADRRPFDSFRLGKALLERRAADPEAIHTVLYLAHRMRAESPALLDIVIGFQLAKQVIEANHPTRPELAPTEAELRRGVLAESVFLMTGIETEAKVDAKIVASLKRDLAAMLLDAPREREAYKQHVAAMVAKAQKDELLAMLVTPRLPNLVEDMYATIDAYR